jgi:hypothetical protein
MKRVRVTPVVSQTSSNTGALVLVGTGATVANKAEDWEKVLEAGAKAEAALAVTMNAKAVNLIFEKYKF